MHTNDSRFKFLCFIQSFVALLTLLRCFFFRVRSVAFGMQNRWEIPFRHLTSAFCRSLVPSPFILSPVYRTQKQTALRQLHIIRFEENVEWQTHNLIFGRRLNVGPDCRRIVFICRKIRMASVNLERKIKKTLSNCQPPLFFFFLFEEDCWPLLKRYDFMAFALDSLRILFEKSKMNFLVTNEPCAVVQPTHQTLPIFRIAQNGRMFRHLTSPSSNYIEVAHTSPRVIYRTLAQQQQQQQ